MSNLKSETVRWVLLISGGLIGAVLSGLYMWWKWGDYAALPDDSFGQMILTFQSSIIFILSIYNVGYFGMKLCGEHQQAEQVAGAKRWHSLALNALLALLFVMAYIFE